MILKRSHKQWSIWLTHLQILLFTMSNHQISLRFLLIIRVINQIKVNVNSNKQDLQLKKILILKKIHNQHFIKAFNIGKQKMFSKIGKIQNLAALKPIILKIDSQSYLQIINLHFPVDHSLAFQMFLLRNSSKLAHLVE